MRSSVAVAASGGVVVLCLMSAHVRADEVQDLIAQSRATQDGGSASDDDAGRIEADAQRRAESPSQSADRDTPPQAAPPSADDNGRTLAPAHDREEDLAWTGSLGLRRGTFIIDGEEGPASWELVGAGGLHFDRLTVLGEYGLSLVHHDADPTAVATPESTTAPPSYLQQTTDGVMHRVGVDVRYAYARSSTPRKYLDEHDSVAEAWVQVGGDAQIIQWDLGGRLVRPELSLVLGADFAFRSPSGHKHGWYVDVRLDVARRIDRNDAAPTCAAPCTEATPPVAWSDRMVMFETGFLFGR